MDSIQEVVEPLFPVLITLLVAAVVLWSADRVLIRTARTGTTHRSTRQLVMIILSLCAVLVVVLSLPVSDKFRADLLRLLGIVVTALVAFSSTTLVANMMAGLMLRSIKSYAPGDFIEAGDFFGKVAERGLFHTEIQSEDRDLVTLPNLFLVTNPVKVVRTSGTAINCVVSLGYDVPRTIVEQAMKDAAAACQLEEPFVQILTLGDYAVTYKAAGFYRDVKHLLSKKSEFKGAVLDTLHREGIEIVSPSFMNQRALNPHEKIIPRVHGESGSNAAQIFPEALMFDKADRAQRIQMLKEKSESLKEQLKALTKESSEEGQVEQQKLESLLEITETLLQRELSRKEND